MTDESEILRRIRSGLNAVLDAASADAIVPDEVGMSGYVRRGDRASDAAFAAAVRGAGEPGTAKELFRMPPTVVKEDWGPYKAGDVLHDGMAVRKVDAVSPAPSDYTRVSATGAGRLELDTSPGYRRDTDETFSEDEIAYMTGGR